MYSTLSFWVDGEHRSTEICRDKDLSIPPLTQVAILDILFFKRLEVKRYMYTVHESSHFSSASERLHTIIHVNNKKLWVAYT